MAFVFFPHDPREKTRTYRAYKPKTQSWVAPEHQVFAKGMKRGKDGILILDPRPRIMIPEQEKKIW